jgi:hypothetical protein
VVLVELIGFKLVGKQPESIDTNAINNSFFIKNDFLVVCVIFVCNMMNVILFN